MSVSTDADPVGTITGFARALRGAGIAAHTDRVASCVAAIGHLDAADRRQVYWAARLSLCAEPDDLPRFDALFTEWFSGRGAARAPRPDARRPGPADEGGAMRGGPSAGGQDAIPTPEDVRGLAASDTTRVQRRPFTELAAHERDEVNRLIARLAPRTSVVPTRRYRPGGRERPDVARTVRRMLQAGGEPVRIARKRRSAKPRRLVLLLDVSGSMAPYADALLRFGHAALRAVPARTEVFTVGSTLTRVTRALRTRDPDDALRAAGEVIPDWSGGTRLGESLRAFLDMWGRRGTARRAVVVIASDGWERGDAGLLGEQMARLSRLAHAVVWIHPHEGRAGFAAATAGMQAALPHVDRIVPGFSFDALLAAVDVIAGA